MSPRLLFRTAHLLIWILLNAVCSGCVGGGLRHTTRDSPVTPPSQDGAAAPARPAAAPPADLNVAAGSVAGYPPLNLRKPRQSRFNGQPESSYRSRVLTEDTIWRGQVLVEGSLTVAPQATVVITPGTTVRFRPSPDGESGLLLIRGRIQAAGTKEQPIIFTADETDPAAGDWQGIMLLDSGKDNLLEWCRIEYAAAGFTAGFSDVVLRETSVYRSRNGMTFRSSSAVMTGGGATECLTGLAGEGSDLDLSGVTFSGNGRGIAVTGGSLFLAAAELAGSQKTAVEATGARLHLERNSVVGNGAGAHLAGSRGDLVGNRIEGNRQGGVELADSPLRISRNRISGNGGVGVLVRSGGGTLWENSLEGNGGGELVVTDAGEVAAPANWWGSADPVRIRERIRVGEGRRVLYVPFLTSPPQER